MTSKLFSGVKAAGKLLKSDPATLIDPRIGALAGEPVFEKQRVSAHMASSLDLAKFVADHGIDTIVLGGFSTSGVILSTVCWAGDHDIRVVVLDDLCADGEIRPACACRLGCDRSPTAHATSSIPCCALPPAPRHASQLTRKCTVCSSPRCSRSRPSS